MQRLTQLVSTGLLAPATLTLLAACGGGGGSSLLEGLENTGASATPTDTTAPVTSAFVPGEFMPSNIFKDLCAVPRTGAEFNDSQGTTLDENQWLRSFSHDTYLWYDEIEDLDPANYTTPEYFDLLRTTELTASGAPKDEFHFTMNTEDFEALTQSGNIVTYGAELALLNRFPPREVYVAFTEPNTSATSPEVNLARGARILEVDGIDLINANSTANVDALNAGLFPLTIGETHDFLIEDQATGAVRNVTMTAQASVTDPVKNVQVINTAQGPVGYLTFNTHIDTAEAQLFDAFTTFEAANVTDLVLDMRYNGGGLLVIANQVASMIAGPAAASGMTFEELKFNDKHTEFDPVTGAPLGPDLFMQTTAGRGSSEAGRVLPALNLSRVFVLSGPDTCSASESIINGLRGIDIEVVLIGDTTCGKPFGFYPFDNCGTTYFTTQFRGANAKDFSDYSEGFSPANMVSPTGVAVSGCAVLDDFSKPLGDPEEARFAVALEYIENGGCPSPDPVSSSSAVASKAAGAKGAATNGTLTASSEPGLAINKGPALSMPGSVRTNPGSF